MKRQLFRLFLRLFPAWYLRKLFLFEKSLKKGTALFIVTRQDLGSYLFSLRYIECWRVARGGEVALIILSSNFEMIDLLSAKLLPHIKVFSLSQFKLLKSVLKKLGSGNFDAQVVTPLYQKIKAKCPELHYLYESSNSTSIYSSTHDPLLQNMPNHPFRAAYEKARKVLDYKDYKREAYDNFFKLHQETQIEKRKTSISPFKRPFVVLNLNCKEYHNEGSNRRKIRSPEKYNVVIDTLIEKGFSVVLQGRKEQPHFEPREHFHNFSKDPRFTIQDDLALYRGASFAISSKSGPENFSLFYDLPLLGLDYTEPVALVPSKKFRFFFKQVVEKKSGRILHWKEFLENPCYFDIGVEIFNSEIDYTEMNEENLVKAVEEFLQCYEKDNWEYSAAQKHFREHLTPLHLDLYMTQGVPLDAYLCCNAQ